MMIFHRPFLSLVVFSLCRDIIVQYCTKRRLHMWISTRTTTTKLRVRNCRQQVRRFVKHKKKEGKEGQLVTVYLSFQCDCRYVFMYMVEYWMRGWQRESRVVCALSLRKQENWLKGSEMCTGHDCWYNSSNSQRNSVKGEEEEMQRVSFITSFLRTTTERWEINLSDETYRNT